MREVQQENPVTKGVDRIRTGVCRLLVAVVVASSLVQSGPAKAQINGEQIRTIVRISTSVGDFSVGLYDEITWRTVANFLGYVNRGDYNQTYIHRTENVTLGDFRIVQGGGFRFRPFEGPVNVPEQDTVRNEPFFSNVRGTMAMAKFPSDPNSATSEWYFNLSDNSASLDTANGGFTVFGEVLGGEEGMATLDTIMNDLQKVDLGPRASFAPLVTQFYEGRPDEEFVFINMEVVDRFSSSVNVYAANQQILIASVEVDGGAEAYSLNFSPVDIDTMKLNEDSVLKLVEAPEGAATFDSGTGRLFFPVIEFSTRDTSFTCTNAEFELESTQSLHFNLLSFDDC